MIRFNSDYTEGAQPRILEKLVETNLEQTPGYSEDIYCEKAVALIREVCEAPDAAVHLLVGGTQTNLTVISAALRPHQGAISADTGHINVHESGAIESTGHKVLTLPHTDGKISAEQVETLCQEHRNDASFEHMVQPKLVYISHPTELGTLYTRAELTALSDCCKRNGLYLFLDGARLGYGLCAAGTDVDLPLLAKCCDAFYIGGTKVGALFGEAVVISNPALQEDFRYLMKQKGGMLAKGRLLGLQFQVLFEENLYFTGASHANRMADLLRNALTECGFSLFLHTTTNQLFPILPDSLLEKLQKEYAVTYWAKFGDGESIVRFCTSWATREDDVQKFIQDLRKFVG